MRFRSNKLLKLGTFNVALYAFISLDPYIRWIIPNEFFYFFFILTTAFFTFALSRSKKEYLVINKNRQWLFTLLAIFIVFFTSPVIHDLRWGHMLWPVPLMFIVFYHDKILFDSYLLLKKIIVFISAAAIIYWILNLLGIPLPHYDFQPDFRPHHADHYLFYGPAASLYRGSTPIGAYYGVERIIGVFKEPGHFGIYLGILLALENFDFKSRANKILYLAGVLTFSTAFFGMIIIGLICHLMLLKKVSKNIVYSFLILLTLFMLSLSESQLGETIENLTYGRVLSRHDITDRNILDSRVGTGFIFEFERYAKTSKVLTGLGYDSLEKGYSSQNYRAIIYRFGLIGFVIVVLMLWVIAKRLKFKDAISIFIIAGIVLAHRSTFFLTPTLFTLLFIGTSFVNVKYYQNIVRNQ